MPIKVCLTGGPCAGKTSAQKYLKEKLEEEGYRVFTVPEISTILLSNGAKYPGNEGKTDPQVLLEYEENLLNLVVAMYDTFIGIAALSEPSAVIFDRGFMDVSAYVTPELWLEILSNLRKSKRQIFNSYDVVCHLVTAAKGAEEHYNLDNNTTRTETPELARHLDDKTLDAWKGHRNLVVVTNEEADNFDDKLDRATKQILKKIKKIAKTDSSSDTNDKEASLTIGKEVPSKRGRGRPKSSVSLVDRTQKLRDQARERMRKWRLKRKLKKNDTDENNNDNDNENYTNAVKGNEKRRKKEIAVVVESDLV